jgi:DNA-directed RNA polymerase
VYQTANKADTKVVKTAINGGVKLTVQYYTDEMDVRKIRQGASPNFVHSMDATHMMMVLNAALDADMTSFAMIHDDFGTHACDIDNFHPIIRDTFVDMYSVDILQDFAEQLMKNHSVKLPLKPAFGTLDLDEVRSAAFFFG